MFESAQVVEGAREWDRLAEAQYEADQKAESADADLRRAIAKDGSDVYGLLNDELCEDHVVESINRLFRLQAAGAKPDQIGVEFAALFDKLVEKAVAA